MNNREKEENPNMLYYQTQLRTEILFDLFTRSRLWRSFLVAALALGWFALSPPAARGVTPAPDGGYPGNNTAEGTNALFSRTTGRAFDASAAESMVHGPRGAGGPRRKLVGLCAPVRRRTELDPPYHPFAGPDSVECTRPASTRERG